MNQLRKKGATTRLVDAAVQELFAVGYCRIADHHDTKSADEQMANILERRMISEHGMRIKMVLGKSGLFAYIEPSCIEQAVPDEKPHFFKRLRSSWNYLFS